MSEIHGLGSEKVFLKDNAAGSTTDLTSVKSYTFTADAGTIASRFSIIIGDPNVAEKPASRNMSFNAFQENDHIAIIPEGDNWTGTTRSSIRIYDSTGNLMLELNNEYLANGVRKEYYPLKPSGLLIVEVINGNEKYYRKIIFNR